MQSYVYLERGSLPVAYRLRGAYRRFPGGGLRLEAFLRRGEERIELGAITAMEEGALVERVWAVAVQEAARRERVR